MANNIKRYNIKREEKNNNEGVKETKDCLAGTSPKREPNPNMDNLVTNFCH